MFWLYFLVLAPVTLLLLLFAYDAWRERDALRRVAMTRRTQPRRLFKKAS